MEEKKKLKKLVLKKEEIVNLNDYQMRQIQGGSTYWCVAQSIIETVASVVSIVTSVYETGKEASAWNCPESQQKDCMGDISKYVMTGGCLIPEVDIPSWYM